MEQPTALLTIIHLFLNIEHMSHYDLSEKLGIASEEEAEELEYELELRFEDFTFEDHKTWLKQTAYLEHFSRIGTVTSAANEARVTPYTVQRWQLNNELGFNRRLEIAGLAFTDSLKEKALRRASEPKAPATLLIELLRAYIPEEFSRNGHKRDGSQSEELFRRYRDGARHDRDAGYPAFRKLAQGAENAYPEDDREPSPSHLSPGGGETQRARDSSQSDELFHRYRDGGRRDKEAGYSALGILAEGAENAYPEDDRPSEPNVYHGKAVTSDDTPPPDARGNTQNPSALTPSPVVGEGWGEGEYLPTSPVVGESPPRTRYGGRGEGDTPGPRAPLSTSTQNPAPGTPTRAGPSVVSPSPSPVVGESPPRTRYGGRGEGDAPGPRAALSTSTQNPAPGTPTRAGPSVVNTLTPERRVPPTRAERREQIRQQRKAEKKNTFPAKRF